MKVLGGLRLIERDADTEEVIRVIEKKNIVTNRGKSEFMRRIALGWTRNNCGYADKYSYKRAVVGLGLGPYSFTIADHTITVATRLDYAPEHEPAPENINLINLAYLKEGSSSYDSGGDRMFWYFRIWEYEFNTVDVVWVNVDPDTGQPSNNPNHGIAPYRANPGVLGPEVREIGLFDPLYLRNYAYPWEGAASDKLDPRTGILVNRIKLDTPIVKSPDRIWDIYIFIKII
jgi:hypothetical protein